MVESVYKVGSEKPSVTSKTDILKSSSHEASGFFSPLTDGFDASPTSQGTPTQAPVVYNEFIYPLGANSLNIVLTIFAANVAVRLDDKMAGELLRATKKNPPSRLRYELIYVSFTVIKNTPKSGFSLLLRQGRTNMTQASGRKRKRRMLLGACFKGFGLIWKGSSHHSE